MKVGKKPIMSEQLRLLLDNRLPELERMSHAVEDFLARCSVTGRAAYHIRLALDELVTNVIRYAHDVQGGHAIELTLERQPGFVEFILEDSGASFNPLDAPEPDTVCQAEDRKIGGLGVHFVRKTMDAVHYERKDGKNILRIRKNIP
jgi:anti-sigma regulatory factor (Ser/Thr protein kinase)